METKKYLLDRNHQEFVNQTAFRVLVDHELSRLVAASQSGLLPPNDLFSLTPECISEVKADSKLDELYGEIFPEICNALEMWGNPFLPTLA